MRHLCVNLFVAAALAYQAQPPEMGILEGRVIDSVTGEPIRKASVTITPGPTAPASRAAGPPRGANRPGALMGLTTDANGVFQGAFPPGSYFARAERNGYVNVPGPVPAIIVTPGGTAKDITLKLSKHGVITGRVFDEDGEPMARVNVQCLKWLPVPQYGQRRLVPQGMTATNDLGEYRIFGITPGKCLVSAQPYNNPSPRGRTRQIYTTVYFPGVPDLSAAQPLDVPPGSTRQGIDLRLRKVTAVHISGKVTGLSTEGQNRRGNSMVFAVPRNSPVGLGANQINGSVNAEGDFDLDNVPSGSYILGTSSFGPNQETRTARLNLEVGDRDMTGLSLALEPTITLVGRIVAPEAPALTSLTVYLQPQNSNASFGMSNTKVDADGSLSIKHLEKDLYNVRLMGMPSGYYVKSIQSGNVESKDTLDLSAGAAGELIITLEKGTAEVTGQVNGKDQKPSANVQVIAVDGRNEVARTSLTDAQGHYRLPDLPPGDYRLVTLAPGEDINDLETIDRLAANGEKVSLAKAARESRQLEIR
jgi:hypothetical protein